jgi:hypothetical protein
MKNQINEFQPASSPDVLLELFLKKKPADGEDFFVFSIVTDCDQPTWELRQNFAGTYQQVAELCVSTLAMMVESGHLRAGIRIELFQCSKARSFLAQLAEEESGYQEQQRSRCKN